jgi:hypothetical protein
MRADISNTMKYGGLRLSSINTQTLRRILLRIAVSVASTVSKPHVRQQNLNPDSRSL